MVTGSKTENAQGVKHPAKLYAGSASAGLMSFTGPNKDEESIFQCLRNVKAKNEGNGKNFKSLDVCIANKTEHHTAPECRWFQRHAINPRRHLRKTSSEASSKDTGFRDGGADFERGSGASSISDDEPTALGSDPAIMQHNKLLFEEGNAEAVAAVRVLRRLADAAAATPDDTVIVKSIMPPTDDKRTYYSLDTYCWPANNSTTNPEGPWAMRDGFPFPGRNELAADERMVVTIFENVHLLGMAYYFTGEERYAARAAEKLRTFFLDDETGMLPDLTYAAMHPGVSEVGRFTGLIHFRNLETLLSGISLMQGSPSWTPEDDSTMRLWMTAYKAFLDGAHVMKERCSVSNHGLYYDLQYVSVLRYLRRNAEAKAYLRMHVKERLRVMIHGAMFPNEMIRPTSYFYQNYILEGAARLASQARLEGVDLWHHQSLKHNSILDAWDWMSPHWCNGGAKWPMAMPKGARMAKEKALEWMGLVYSEVSVPDAYTLRSREYARTFAALKASLWLGHSDEIPARMLTRVRLDDCFLDFCHNRKLLNEDPVLLPTGCPKPSLTPANPTDRSLDNGWSGCVGDSCVAWVSSSFSLFLLVATLGLGMFPFIRRLLFGVASSLMQWVSGSHGGYSDVRCTTTPYRLPRASSSVDVSAQLLTGNPGAEASNPSRGVPRGSTQSMWSNMESSVDWRTATKRSGSAPATPSNKMPL